MASTTPPRRRARSPPAPSCAACRAPAASGDGRRRVVARSREQRLQRVVEGHRVALREPGARFADAGGFGRDLDHRRCVQPVRRHDRGHDLRQRGDLRGVIGVAAEPQRAVLVHERGTGCVEVGKPVGRQGALGGAETEHHVVLVHGTEGGRERQARQEADQGQAGGCAEMAASGVHRLLLGCVRRVRLRNSIRAGERRMGSGLKRFYRFLRASVHVGS